MKALKLLIVTVLMAMPNTIEVSLQINPDLRACVAYYIYVAPILLQSETKDNVN